MIGIGVTTKDRSNILRITLENLKKFLPENCFVVVCDDTEDLDIMHDNRGITKRLGFQYKHDGSRKGVAKNKNLCLTSLRHCDYIFLFDDDCYPLREGWAEYIIDCHKKSGVHHFNLLDKAFHEHMSTREYEGFCIEEYRTVGGVFMFLTKDVIEKVGAFNKNYGTYGFEHATYTYRVYKSGLHNNHGINLTIGGLQDYIFSLDYARFASNTNHNIYINSNYESIFIRSINQAETDKSIADNYPIMAEDVNGPIFREL